MKPLPVIACLLIATAGTIVFLSGRNDGNPSSPPTSTRAITRERPSNSVSSAAKFIESARHLSLAERQDQIRALSDSDLQRLTRAVIAEYLSAMDDTSRRASVPLLTLLAMESGRRDFDGFAAEIDKRGEQGSPVFLELKLNLRALAAAGLAEQNPQRAAEIQIHDGFTSFPYPATYPAAREAIFRAWARMAPDAAWQAVSANLESGESAPIQGLLAEIKDPALRATILHRGLKPVANNQASVGTITHNYHLTVSTALGLAEQDPDAAWEWIKNRPTKASPRKDGDVSTLLDIQIIDRHFNSQSREFLREWAVRQPEQATAFLNRHADTLSNPEQLQLSFGLLHRDPVSAINALTGFTDPNQRLGWFSTLIKTFPSHSNENAWPVLPYLNDTLPRSQILSTVSQNLGHLHLPPDLEAQALQTVRAAQQALAHSQDLPPE